MSSSDRRTVLVALGISALGVSGCLRPLLAEGEAARSLRNQIALPDVRNRFSYFLNDGLEARLGEARDPQFRLQVIPLIEQAGVAISADNSATRITLNLTASWSLIRIADAETVLSGSEALQSGYNSTSSLYATRQTRLDVERRLALELAERIARQIQARATSIAV